jgi:uncharacterized protein (DUF2235 family)
MKKIILSSDGTGSRGGTGYDTNVWKLHTAINQRYDNAKYQQIAYYHDGVGTEDLKLLKILGGITGWGMQRIIIDLYIFLINNYSNGDQIYLFGFSRGAYTVRMLAGFIISCGILKRNKTRHRSDAMLKKEVEILYQAFLNKNHTLKDKRQLKSQSYWVRKIATIRKYCRNKSNLLGKNKTTFNLNSEKNIYKNRKIHFIGVWDTVDAYAIPSDWGAKLFDLFFYTSFREYDNQLNQSVLAARHAISIDEPRQVFAPVLWRENHPNLKQVWFAGVHSNVGGGYPKQGLAWISLEWMMSEVEALGDKTIGIEFTREDHQQYYENKTIYDKLYNSRSGAATFYMYKSRDIDTLYNTYIACQENTCGNLLLDEKKITVNKALIHLSVFERILSRVEGYSPMNLPTDFAIEVTRPNKAQKLTHPPLKTNNKENIQQLRTAIIKDFKQLTQQNTTATSKITGIFAYLKEKHIYCTHISLLIIVTATCCYYFFSDNSLFFKITTLLILISTIASLWLFSHHAHNHHQNRASTIWRKIIANKAWYFLKMK